ncbi:hypothetical protein [Paraflavitalea speifideaquila]|uniref:hypothetical protein n=1 Tax=Paraflavitalea speifideaquila TaxID=3076558 RepID=UPI0028E3CD87|nr:hypothetical protein [Paraflavitalea speifideiaquila]
MNGQGTGNGSSPSASNPVLDDYALQNWESISTAIPMASDDGQYFVYRVNRRNTQGKIILQAIETGWQYNLGSVRPIGFSKKSRFFLFTRLKTVFVFMI